MKMNNKKWLVFVFVLWAFLGVMSIHAQETESLELEVVPTDENNNLDFEIETEQEISTPFFDVFLRNFSGSLVSSGAAGNYGNRLNSSLLLQYSHLFGNWGRLQFTGNAYSSSVELNLRLKDEVRENQDASSSSPDEKTIIQSSSNFEFREAYFDWNIGESLQLSVGNKLITFGQFEIFSPIDFALPTRFSSSALSFSKLNNRLTQQTLQLNIYPTSTTELQFFYFPKIATDPLLEDSLDVFSAQEYNRCNTNKDCAKETNITPTPAINIPIEDETQRATRLVFYQNWGNFGLTHHNGYGNFGFVARDTISVLKDNETSNASDDFIEESGEFVRRDIYGLEFAIPSGSWTWKGEITYNPSVTQVFDLRTRNLHPHPLDIQEQSARVALERLLEWIKEENNNSLNFEGQSYFTALGVDADLALWKLNLVFFFFQSVYESNIQEGRDLFSEWYKIARGETFEAFDQDFFPSFNIARYWNNNKTTSIGLIAGIIPVGIGASFYFNQEYFESLVIAFALESIDYNGDQQLLFDETDYEPTEDLSTGIRFGLGYKF